MLPRRASEELVDGDGFVEEAFERHHVAIEPARDDEVVLLIGLIEAVECRQRFIRDFPGLRVVG